MVKQPQIIKEETTKASANTAKEVIKLVCSKQQKEPYKQQQNLQCNI